MFKARTLMLIAGLGALVLLWYRWPDVKAKMAGLLPSGVSN